MTPVNPNYGAHSTLCPKCPGDVGLLVDWKRSRLDEIPQRLAVICPACGFKQQSLAPTTNGGDGRYWRAATITCRICSAEQVSVYPMGCDGSALECANCGNMAGEADTENDL